MNDFRTKVQKILFLAFFSSVTITGHAYSKSPRSRNWVANEDGKWSGGGENDPMKETCSHCLNWKDAYGSCGKDSGYWEDSHKYRLSEILVRELVLIRWHNITANSCLPEGYDDYNFLSDFESRSTVGICSSLLEDSNGTLEQFWNCEVKLTASGPISPIASQVKALTLPIGSPTKSSTSPIASPSNATTAPVFPTKALISSTASPTVPLVVSTKSPTVYSIKISETSLVTKFVPLKLSYNLMLIIALSLVQDIIQRNIDQMCAYSNQSDVATFTYIDAKAINNYDTKYVPNSSFSKISFIKDVLDFVRMALLIIMFILFFFLLLTIFIGQKRQSGQAKTSVDDNNKATVFLTSLGKKKRRSKVFSKTLDTIWEEE